MKCHIHNRQATHMQKFGYCTFWTPVCMACRNETPWHATKKIRKQRRSRGG